MNASSGSTTIAAAASPHPRSLQSSHPTVLQCFCWQRAQQDLREGGCWRLQAVQPHAFLAKLE